MNLVFPDVEPEDIEAAKGIVIMSEQSALRVALAAYAHGSWSGWLKYVFDDAQGSENADRPARTWTVNSRSYERWRRQMNTPYHDLPEHEKISDGLEADNILAVIWEQFRNTRQIIEALEIPAEFVEPVNIPRSSVLDEIVKLRSQLTKALISMDHIWEENNEGQDWAGWCKETRELLDESRRMWSIGSLVTSYLASDPVLDSQITNGVKRDTSGRGPSRCTATKRIIDGKTVRR
jgi:hypothetical protein